MKQKEYKSIIGRINGELKLQPDIMKLFKAELVEEGLLRMRKREVLTKNCEYNWNRIKTYYDENKARIDRGIPRKEPDLKEVKKEEARKMQGFNYSCKQDLDLIKGTAKRLDEILETKIMSADMRSSISSMISGIIATATAIGIESERHGVANAVMANMQKEYGVYQR